ncbi:sulfate reduction electron transfer complex DsrMKJOP subunit DsrO [Desulfovibrio sp.]|uniref:sulfate reduction electron transfer complex DsrMKJOP subunit DsrO n=1 Tax=Desulfovibrio sp. TaxID=885 RepID=UPI00341EF475
MQRRTFLSLCCVSAASLLPGQALAGAGESKSRYAMVIDLRRCIGCQSCTVTCGAENAVPLGNFRTTVSEYAMIGVPAENREPSVAVIPRLCNHCETPPCVPVCPVGATFKRADGMVLIDATTCIGCGFCVQACPYDARFLNRETHTADKCTFCAHRTAAGLLPACVENCVGGARIFGDLRDPQSAVSKMLAAYKGRIAVLYPDKSTDPHVFYLGLDRCFTRSDTVPQPMPITPLERT